MSIATKTGDSGSTGLMYNRRVSKDHPRVEACGAVDELNAAVGLARANCADSLLSGQLHSIQKDLVCLMGELAVDPPDLERYFKDGFEALGPEKTAKLDLWVKQIEAEQTAFTDWAMPGQNLLSAALDLARTVCRRAERRVCALKNQGGISNPEIVIFLNRLSDLLWLMARSSEGPERGQPCPQAPI